MVKNDIQGMNLQPQKEPEQKQSSWKKYVNRRTLSVGAMGVLAMGSGIVVVNGGAKDVLKSTVNEVTVSVQKTRHGTTFDKKDILLKNESIKEASSEAIDKIAPEWTDNSVDEIRSEVERQRNTGLDAYVSQWGDTYSNLAKAINMPIDELLKLNGSPEKPIIYAGDVVDGVLYQLSNADRLTDDNLVSVSTDVGNAEKQAEMDAEAKAKAEDEAKTVVDKEDLDNDEESSDETTTEEVEESTDTSTIGDESETEGVSPAKAEDIDQSVPEITEGVAEGVENNLDNSNHEVQVMSVRESSRMDDLKYKIEETIDPELSVGQRITLQGGAPGAVRVPITIVTYSDGTVEETEGDPIVLAEPINEVVRIGSLTDADGNDLSVETEELKVSYTPFETEEIYDKTLRPNERKVVTQGVHGQTYEIIRTLKDQHGEILESEVIDENFEGLYEPEGYEAVAKEAVNEIIHVGPKPIELEKDAYDRIVEEEMNMKLPSRSNVEYVIPGEEFQTIDGPMTLAEGEQYKTTGGRDGLYRHKDIVYYLNDEIVLRQPVYESLNTIIEIPVHNMTYIAEEDPDTTED